MKITDLVPDWNEPTTAAQRRKELREYALSQGFNANDVTKFGKDGRIVTAMMKAKLYDQMVAKIPGKQPYEKSQGGHIQGPGTATSDSIPARLSDGEYVIKAPVVAALGVEFFDRLNNLASHKGKR
jgi:hypothetical protein